LFNYGLAEYESARFSNSTSILNRAWKLRADDDPLKEPYARVMINRLTHAGRSWINLRHESYISEIVFSPDGSRVATLSGYRVNLFEIDQLLPKDLSRFISHSTGESDSSRPWGSEFERKLVALQHKRSLRYRQSIAIKAVKEKDWFAAKLHLPWLIDHEPNNSQWKDLLAQVQSLSIERKVIGDVKDKPKVDE